MSGKDLIIQEGEIYETLSNIMFRVRLKNGHQVLATVSGKMKMKYVKMVVGDKVRLEMSPYDLTRGRITSRLDNENRSMPVFERSTNNNYSTQRKKK